MSEGQLIETNKVLPILIVPKYAMTDFDFEDRNDFYITIEIHEESLIYSGPIYVKLVESYGYYDTSLTIANNIDYSFVLDDITYTNNCSPTNSNSLLDEFFSDICNYVGPNNAIDEDAYAIDDNRAETIYFDHLTSSPINEINLNASGKEFLIDFNDKDCLFLPYESNEAITDQSSSIDSISKVRKVQEDVALQQLMTPGLQATPKQRKTILFIGNDAENGETVQKIAMTDPFYECADKVDNSMSVYEPIQKQSKPKTGQKKFQCGTCSQIFDKLADFKQHMVVNHKSRGKRLRSLSDGKIACTFCDRSFKNEDKLKRHMEGHGDPQRECTICNKVLCSKVSLKNHLELHNRICCRQCNSSFRTKNGFELHLRKTHSKYTCNQCNAEVDVSFINEHEEMHKNPASPLTDSDINDILSKTDTDTLLSGEGDFVDVLNDVDIQVENSKFSDEIEAADNVIAKVISNEVFLTKQKKHGKYNKACNVCSKTFQRIGDLKRHLIEHIVKSTMSKNPVDENGTLNLQCEVCLVENFPSIEKYKAHLREHAQLTIYRCTICDKSFSDSSNFSKHKKVHGKMYLQCDICQRKFNSKKMITQHMEYHNKTQPLYCRYCSKEFHFQSCLNKHIKFTHSKQPSSKYHCKFCDQYFVSLKIKWDHEWSVHKMRKMIVDCSLCRSKFRKYSELKRHCNEVHKKSLPPKKRFFNSCDDYDRVSVFNIEF